MAWKGETTILIYLVTLAIYAFSAWQLTVKGYPVFIRQGWLCPNYRGEPIVQGFGIYFFIHYLLFIVMIKGIAFVWPNSLPALPYEAVVFSFILSSLSVMGWIDDHWGNRLIKGLKGHLLLFLKKGKITTGLAKAVLGLMLALLVSRPLSASFWNWMLFILAMVFSIHTFNLLDVRPGRAIKSYWLFTLSLLPFFSQPSLYCLYTPSLVTTLILFQYDRRRLAMLGDAGSLTLGGIFGYQLILDAPHALIILWTLFFLFITILAETTSLTEVIKKRAWLNRLDHWGIIND